MKSENPDSKSINIKTKEGLELLKTKAQYYGHYADQLKVMELIQEIEALRALCAPVDTKAEMAHIIGRMLKEE